MILDGRHERRPVADLRDDGPTRFLDQPRQPLADERRILRDDDPERRPPAPTPTTPPPPPRPPLREDDDLASGMALVHPT